MNLFARTDRSILGRWWWTVDHWTLGAVLGLLVIGIVLIGSGSVGVSNTIGLDPFHFLGRHLLYAPVALGVLLAASLLTPRDVRLAAVGLYAVTLLLLAAVLVFGEEAKGARRWIGLFGFTLQPSEFMKPVLAVLSAWLFVQFQATRQWLYMGLNLLAVGLALVLIASQPDIGMAVVIAAVWGVQFFLAGMPLVVTGVLGGLGAAGLGLAYMLLPHVQSRIDRFLNPEEGDTYQVDMSLAAFREGGWFGVGPGNGDLKHVLPDAHSDFILAVAAEEFGAILCLLLVGLIAVVLARGFSRVLAVRSPFVALAAAGLLASFALQSLINMASTLALIPAKGMTLPFISYGGSSMLAVALVIGFLLALTRRRIGHEPEDEI
ncbi:MAG TPA: putative peptidoglycan glycosyltransferase FtsW [Alphaproteobacteria bacterium]|nr:putative peptidoglycan glycosyltransferase FtsW [Alphaproteobacteria bacterium]